MIATNHLEVCLKTGQDDYKTDARERVTLYKLSMSGRER